MPRVVQPGGGGGKMRVRYTARRKRGLVAASKRMMAEGKSLRAAADELRVSAANLSKWASQGMGEIDRVDKILRCSLRSGHRHVRLLLALVGGLGEEPGALCGSDGGGLLWHGAWLCSRLCYVLLAIFCSM